MKALTLPRISTPLAALLAVIVLFVLVDVGIVALRLTSNHPIGAPPGQSGPTSSGHPCNHGAYVSQAAHANKGGHYVSSVAKGKLGKNGDCSVPLPAAPAAASGADD
jgi:hypothetical protein